MKDFKIFKKSIFLLILTLAGCSKGFIQDVNSPSRIPVNGYYTSQADFQAALTGVYSTLRARYDNFFIMAEVPSDNIESINGVVANTGNLDALSYGSTEPAVQTAYLGYYTTIAQCNNFLNQIAPFSMDAILKARWIAEAKFIRALMYFDLVRFYGNIPLVLNPITDDSSYTYPQAGSAAVYTQIIADLKDAEPVLPANYTASGATTTGGSYTANDVGRATSGAVKGLLGKVYLTQGDYADAAAKLKEIIASGVYGYTLLPKYSDVFSQTNKNNAETIFSIQYTSGVFNEGSNFAINFFPPVNPSELVNVTPIGLGQATASLFKTFEANDLRTATSVVLLSPTGTAYYYTRKYVEQPLAKNQGNCNWIILRYSDVLLMEAEALAQLNDPTAISYLNQVRTRAGLPNKVFSNQATLITDILHERRVELCYEGQRWFDLVRTNTFISALTTEFTADGFTKNIPNITAGKMLYPIPFRETTLNPSYTQNPGY